MTAVHDPASRKFSIALPSDEEAYLRYESDSRQLNISTTFVPTSARGQGLGRVLVDAAREFANTNHLKLTSTCWYASRILAETPPAS